MRFSNDVLTMWVRSCSGYVHRRKHEDSADLAIRADWEVGRMKTNYPYIKIYRYRLKPGVWDQFLALQRRADSLYSKHFDYQIEFIRDHEDIDEVTEVQKYRSEDEALEAENLHEVELQLRACFAEFQSLLSPDGEGIESQLGELTLIR